jgi:hypothetical protein
MLTVDALLEVGEFGTADNTVLVGSKNTSELSGCFEAARL